MSVAAGSKEYKLDGKRFIVDPEFKDYLGKLEPRKLAILEANLLSEGCLDPIVVWAEENIVVDGMNRIELCTKHSLLYKVVRINLPSREAAKDWMLDHQEGKRNLSDEAMARLRERRRERVVEAAAEGKSNRTIAKQEGVSRATIANDLLGSGGQGLPPAKVQGADGKKYPSREERLGLNHTPPKPKIKRGERVIGGDEEAEKAAAKSKKTDPKQGHAKFDWKPFEKHFAKLMLMPDLIGKAYGAHNSTEAKALREELMLWRKKFKTWSQAISKVKPPLSFGEK